MNTHVMSARSMSAHVVVRLVSLAARLRATFRRSAQWCIAPGDTPRSSIGWRYLRKVTGITMSVTGVIV